MLHVVVTRQKQSYNYKRNKKLPGAWDNNDANNSEDTFELYDGSSVLLTSPCQSVSNMEGLDSASRYEDTLAPGNFQLKAFVEGRQHYGRIHGICDAMTLGGEHINSLSVTATNGLRWLCHDWEKLSPANQPGNDTRVAWSSGCLVIPDKQLAALGAILDKYNVTANQYIPGYIKEV